MLLAHRHTAIAAAVIFSPEEDWHEANGGEHDGELERTDITRNVYLQICHENRLFSIRIEQFIQMDTYLQPLGPRIQPRWPQSRFPKKIY